MYVRMEGEGVRAGYILNNVSNCVFFFYLRVSKMIE
jgi:hypothetical protein